MMNVEIFSITVYGIAVIVNPFTAITVIWPIKAMTNMYYMLSSSRYICVCLCACACACACVCVCVHLNTQCVYSEIVTLTCRGTVTRINGALTKYAHYFVM